MNSMIIDGAYENEEIVQVAFLAISASIGLFLCSLVKVFPVVIHVPEFWQGSAWRLLNRRLLS